MSGLVGVTIIPWTVDDVWGARSVDVLACGGHVLENKQTRRGEKREGSMLAAEDEEQEKVSNAAGLVELMNNGEKNSSSSNNGNVETNGLQFASSFREMEVGEVQQQQQQGVAGFGNGVGSMLPEGKGAAAERKQDNMSFWEKVKEIVLAFGPLGFIAFGGPTAHTALLRDRFVEKLMWIDHGLFMELFSVSSALPGPSSTQLVVGIAAIRHGIPATVTPDWMVGFGPAAVALVFVAAFQLSKNVVQNNVKTLVCAFSIVITTLILGDTGINAQWASFVFPILLLFGGIVTLIDSKRPGRRGEYIKPPKEGDIIQDDDELTRRIKIGKWTGAFLVFAWLVILVVFVSLRFSGDLDNDKLAMMFESFFRVGSIIYGGGHVVLPMLLAEVVNPGWVTRVQYYQGFVLAQAMPGPLFTFAVFLGAAAFRVPGAFVGFIGLFAPGVMLVIGFLPFWSRVRRVEWVKIMLQGAGAAGVGLIGAACIQLFEDTVQNAAGSTIVVITIFGVGYFNVPAPVGILFGGLFGWILSPAVGDFSQTPYTNTSLSTG